MHFACASSSWSISIFKQKKAILINFTMSVVSVESDKGISRQTIACSFSMCSICALLIPKITKPKISWLKSTSQKGDSQPTVSNALDGKVNAVCGIFDIVQINFAESTLNNISSSNLFE